MSIVQDKAQISAQMSAPMRKIIGLMSGTSLDGVDAAMLITNGEQIKDFGKTAFRPYSAQERLILQEATQDALAWQFNGPEPKSFRGAANIIHQAHIEAVQMIGTDGIDLIGFHGQTLLHHAPQKAGRGHKGNKARLGRSLQLGEGRVLAKALGVDVVYDFRSADIAAGGHGAPLAPIYHKALLERAGRGAGSAVLNIGGVSNITLISADGELMASDCGPGNGPLDNWAAQHGAGAFDKDGALSLAGSPDFTLIERWLERPFFEALPPKSADRYDFDVLGDMAAISAQDGATTLCAFTARSVQKCLSKMGQAIEICVVCGGGRHNKAMMLALTESLKCEIISADDLGWDGDALEAQAFAFMAARFMQGLPSSAPLTTGATGSIIAGRLAKS